MFTSPTCQGRLVIMSCDGPGVGVAVGVVVGVDVGAAVGVGVAVAVGVDAAVGVDVAPADGVGVPSAAVEVVGVGVDRIEATGWNRKLHFPKASRSSAINATTAMPLPLAPSASLVPPSPLQNKLR
jgi:hypothetical protein